MAQPFPCFTARPSKNNEGSYVGIIITAKGKGCSGWNQIEVKLLLLQLMVWSSLPFSCSNTKLFFAQLLRVTSRGRFFYLFLE